MFHVQYCVYECTIPLATVKTGRQRNHITDVQPHSKFHPAWTKLGLQHLAMAKNKRSKFKTGLIKYVTTGRGKTLNYN